MVHIPISRSSLKRVSFFVVKVIQWMYMENRWENRWRTELFDHLDSEDEWNV